MFRHLLLLLLVTAPVGTTHGFAQLHSGAASVTLLAHLDESFSLQSVEIPDSEPLTAESTIAPRLLQVMMGWRLRPGVDFHLEYALSRGTEAGPPSSDRIVLSRVPPVPPTLSFLPVITETPKVVGAWGSMEADAVGAAGLSLVLPPLSESQPATLRLTLIAL